MIALFWISIALWLVALLAYALMLGGYSGSRKLLLRVVIFSAIAAMLTGGLYMAAGI
jgi:hypothetical protein